VRAEIQGDRREVIGYAHGSCGNAAAAITADMKKQYTVSDGKLVLLLREAEEGGFVVTSPLDPELITEAESVSEAFENARDALRALTRSRAKPF
jgi:hypothetical protein